MGAFVRWRRNLRPTDHAEQANRAPPRPRRPRIARAAGGFFLYADAELPAESQRATMPTLATSPPLATSPSLAADFRAVLPQVPCSDDAADRAAYARDLWPRHHLAIRSGARLESEPAFIVWPRNESEVQAIVRWAGKEQVHIVPFGAGSGVCAGVLPHPRALVLDLKRMGRVRAYDRNTPSVEVEAGAMGSTFEEELQAQGFTLGHFPSSIVCSTVGGWLAGRSAGQCSSKYGKIEDMVLSMDVVLGTGELVRLHQRAHGPSLCPIFVGSEGTLGVITSCRLRLHENPTRRAFGAFSFPSTQAGWEGMRKLLQAGLRPAVARLYDPFDARMAKAGRVKRKGEKSSATHAIEQFAMQTLLRRPYGINALVHAAGDHLLGRALVLLIFEGGPRGGNADQCDADMSRAKELLGSAAQFEGEGPARKWLEHRYSVSYRQAPVLSSGMFVDTMEVAATWQNLPALYEGVRNALAPHAFVMAHMSHAYADGCAIYFSFAGVGAPSNGENADAACEARYDAAWRAALAAADEAGGVIAHHHGVGRSKAPRLRQEQGEGGLDTFLALKAVMDPQGILNPGNLVPIPTPDPYLARAGRHVPGVQP